MKLRILVNFVFLCAFSNGLPSSYSSGMNDPLLASLGLGSMGMPMNGMGGMSGMSGMSGMYGGMPPPMPPPGMSPYGMNGMGYGMLGPMGGMYGSGMSPYGMGSMGGLGSQMSFPFMGKK